MNKHFHEIDESAGEPRPGHAQHQGFTSHYGGYPTESPGSGDAETASNEEKDVYASYPKGGGGARGVNKPGEKVSVMSV
jgi:hypothetical protein